MTVAQKKKYHLQQTFGLEPVALGTVEFYLKEVLAEEKRRLATQLLIISILAVASVPAGWAGLSPIAFIVGAFLVAEFVSTTSEIRRCSDLIGVEDLPRWLLILAESNKGMQEKLINLGRRQRGIYLWQIYTLKSWEDDKRREKLKVAIERGAVAS